MSASFVFKLSLVLFLIFVTYIFLLCLFACLFVLDRASSSFGSSLTLSTGCWDHRHLPPYVPGSCGAADETQGFMQVRQALFQSRDSLKPQLYVSPVMSQFPKWHLVALPPRDLWRHFHPLCSDINTVLHLNTALFCWSICMLFWLLSLS